MAVVIWGSNESEVISMLVLLSPWLFHESRKQSLLPYVTLLEFTVVFLNQNLFV